MDLSKLSDAELEAIAAGGTPAAAAPDVASMSDAELESIASGASATGEDPSLLSKMGTFLKTTLVKPVAPVLETISKPMVELDKVTGAPLRAGVGAAQRGEGLGGAASAVVDQLKAGLPSADPTAPAGIKAGELLPTTPTGEDIAFKGITDAGIHPEFAKTMAPMAGLMTESALDVTNFIPGQGATKALKGARKALLGGVGAAERAAAKGVMGVGRVMTQGNIDFRKAVKAANNLSSLELIFPGTENFGPMRKAIEEVGAARAAIQQNKVTVPGSHAVAADVMAQIRETAGRTMSHPGAEDLIGKIKDRAFERQLRTVDVPVPDADIDNVIAATEKEVADLEHHVVHSPMRPGEEAQGFEIWKEHLADAKNDLVALQGKRQSGQPFTRQIVQEELVPRDLTLDELDDLTGMLDELVYTGTGTARSMRRVWGPAVKQSRAALDEAMQTVPEGAMFKETKQPLADLHTAAKGRSKLMTGFVAGVMSGAWYNPAALLAASLLPQTYYKTMGVLKLPGDMARTMLAAHETGKLAVMRDAIAKMAEKYPVATEKLIRATTLVAGKPEAQQFLTEDEANTLALPRSFDPEDIAVERQRLQSDPSVSSIEKAKQLSNITKNGYVTLPARPKPEPESGPKPQSPIKAGGVDDLIRSLEAVRGGP